MEMQHIVFIHKDFPYGGAEKVTYDVANYLCSHGFMVSILTAHHHLQLYPSDARPAFNTFQVLHGNIKASWKTARTIRDFVIKEKVFALVTYRELLYADWLKRQTGVKIVFELHSLPYYEFIDIKEKQQHNLLTNMVYRCGFEQLLTTFYRKKYRRIYRWADAYGVLCHAYKKKVITELGLNEDNKICVLPNPVEHPQHIKMQKQKIIAYVGRLSRRDKRVDRLLRIWQKCQKPLHDWQLSIIGSGEEEDYLQKMSQDLNLKRVSFLGYKKDMQPFYDEAAILCMTSSFEGWPMSVAEAQANGVVPVMFDSFDGAREMISSPDEGVLVTPFDEEAYATSLTQLALDDSRRRRMQDGVIRKAKSYSTDRTGKKWIQMLKKL